jgi:hypothetical protein
MRPSVGVSSGPLLPEISAGIYHNCAAKADGTVTCWGAGTVVSSHPQYGQSMVPAGLTGVAEVVAGGYTTCAHKSDGTLVCWGESGIGREPEPEGTFIQVSVGIGNACGIRPDGSLFCWGDLRFGLTTPPSGQFTQVSVNKYSDHACGVRSDGTLACWGTNTNGRASPPSGTFAQVSAGQDHTCGVRTDGTIACWGAGTTNTGVNPHFGQAAPPPGGGFVSVGTGLRHSCALRTDGTVTCWGAGEPNTQTFPKLRPEHGAQRRVHAAHRRLAPRLRDAAGLHHHVLGVLRVRPDLTALAPCGAGRRLHDVGALTSAAWHELHSSATGGGSGNPVTFTSQTPAVCSFSGTTLGLVAVGQCIVTANQAGNALYLDGRATQSFNVVYNFGATTGGGFTGPVSSTGFNAARAGQAVPVSFDLGGDQGLLVLAYGYPQSIPIACPNGSDPTSLIPEATVTAGGSSLGYDSRRASTPTSGRPTSRGAERAGVRCSGSPTITEHTADSTSCVSSAGRRRRRTFGVGGGWGGGGWEVEGVLGEGRAAAWCCFAFRWKRDVCGQSVSVSGRMPERETMRVRLLREPLALSGPARALFYPSMKS